MAPVILFREPDGYGEPPSVEFLARELPELLEGETFTTDVMLNAANRATALARDFISASESYHVFTREAALAPIGTLPASASAILPLAGRCQAFCEAMETLWRALATIAVPHLQRRDEAAQLVAAGQACYLDQDTIVQSAPCEM
jgi:hypothetical protein